MTNKEINKYQIALDNVRKAPSFMGGNPKYKGDALSQIPFEEDIAILQELVNNVNKLQQENESLKEVIKDNFGFSKSLGIYFVYNSPVNEETIKEVLEND